MSSYVVSHATITVVVEVLTEGLEATYDSARCLEKRTQLGQDLLEMNYRAIRERYGDKEPARVMLANLYPYEHPGNIRKLSPIAALKVIQCYMYQCSEGDISSEKLFERCKEAHRQLAGEIIMSLPEYDSAPWGLE